MSEMPASDKGMTERLRYANWRIVAAETVRRLRSQARDMKRNSEEAEKTADMIERVMQDDGR